MSAETEDDFQKELIAVFVQEAQEWLQQIHVALDELQQGPSPDRHRKLAHTIKAGLANLGGTAATINLNEVERVSFATLPFVEAIQDPSAAIPANHFVVLCKHLGHIHSALTQATGVTFNPEHKPAAGAGHPVTIPSSELLTALNGLRERQTTSGPLHRNLVQNVISQVEGLVKNGVGQCNVTSLREFLDRTAAGEDGFFQLVREQLPGLTQELGQLKSGASGPGHSPDRLQAVVDQVAKLCLAAQRVNASQAMTFFTGLHSFLTLVKQQRVVVASNRYEAVESRLIESTKFIQEWIEIGRAERSAIGGVLPH